MAKLRVERLSDINWALLYTGTEKAIYQSEIELKMTVITLIILCNDSSKHEVSDNQVGNGLQWRWGGVGCLQEMTKTRHTSQSEFIRASQLNYCMLLQTTD